jgi:hypothetical protein
VALDAIELPVSGGFGGVICFSNGALIHQLDESRRAPLHSANGGCAAGNSAHPDVDTQVLAEIGDEATAAVAARP